VTLVLAEETLLSVTPVTPKDARLVVVALAWDDTPTMPILAPAEADADCVEEAETLVRPTLTVLVEVADALVDVVTIGLLATAGGV